MFADISISLDGYVAGPDQTLEQPLGRGGEQLHEWIFGLRSWRETHGREGGEGGADDEVLQEAVERQGATVMGRRMFSGGSGGWDGDPRAQGWWGDEPPFRRPVFVVTHHEREPLALTGTTFEFVTGGVEEAVARAREASGGKDVGIAGGGEVIRRALAAGVVDELDLHVAPVVLGGGAPLFDASVAGVRLEQVRVLHSPAVTHLRYRVVR